MEENMAEKLAQLMKRFEELQFQELIKELRGKIETRSEKEAKRDALSKKLEEMLRRESDLEGELEQVILEKLELSKEVEAVFIRSTPKWAASICCAASEEKMSMTFGGELGHLRQYIEHSKSVRMINMRNLLHHQDADAFENLLGGENSIIPEAEEPNSHIALK